MSEMLFVPSQPPQSWICAFSVYCIICVSKRCAWLSLDSMSQRTPFIELLARWIPIPESGSCTANSIFRRPGDDDYIRKKRFWLFSMPRVVVKERCTGRS